MDMDIILLGITVVSLIVTLVMSVAAWRLARDEKKRSAARVAALSLAAGFWLAYRPRKDDCVCGTSKSRKAARLGLWITTLLTVAIAAYPMLGARDASAGSADAEAKASLDLDVIGMDCKECTSTIANAIKKVPGVVSVTVEFESGKAVVRYDGRDGMADAAIKAVEKAGYRAELQP